MSAASARPAVALAPILVAAAIGFLIPQDERLAVLIVAVPVAVLAAAAVARQAEHAVLAIALLLATFPVLRVEFGSVPVYLTDLLVALALIGVAVRGVRIHRYGVVVLVYLATWIPAWVYQVTSLDIVLEPTYGLIRNVLAVAVFFVALQAIRTAQAGWKLFSVLAGGTVMSGLLAVAQELPATQSGVSQLLLNLAPDFAGAGYQVYPERAFALLTAPTTLAGFLAVMAPPLIVLFAQSRGGVKALAGAALIAATGGLIATYSRQWTLALAVGLALLCLLRLERTARVVAIVAASAFAAWALIAGGALDSSYLGQRFSSLGLADANVQTRLERQQEFLTQAVNDPAMTLVGHGFAGQDIVARGLVDQSGALHLREGVSDNSFLLEIFNSGFVAGLLYLGLLVAALLIAVRAVRRGHPHRELLAGLAAALATAITLHLLDNYFSSAVFMKTLLWLLVGATIALARPPTAGEKT